MKHIGWMLVGAGAVGGAAALWLHASGPERPAEQIRSLQLPPRPSSDTFLIADVGGPSLIRIPVGGKDRLLARPPADPDSLVAGSLRYKVPPIMQLGRPSTVTVDVTRGAMLPEDAERVVRAIAIPRYTKVELRGKNEDREAFRIVSTSLAVQRIPDDSTRRRFQDTLATWSWDVTPIKRHRDRPSRLELMVSSVRVGVNGEVLYERPVAAFDIPVEANFTFVVVQSARSAATHVANHWAIYGGGGSVGGIVAAAWAKLRERMGAPTAPQPDGSLRSAPDSMALKRRRRWRRA